MEETTPQNPHIKTYIVLGTLIVVAGIINLFGVMIYGGGINGGTNPPTSTQPTTTQPRLLLTDQQKQQIEQRLSASTTVPKITTKQKAAIQKRVTSGTIPTLTPEQKAEIEARLR